MAFLIEKNKILKIFNCRAALHFYFWVTIWTGAIIIDRIVGTLFKSGFSFFAGLLVLPIAVYTHFYIIKKFFTKKKFTFYLLGLFVILYLSAKFFRIFVSENFRTYNSFEKSMLHIFLLLIVSTGLKFLKSGFQRQIDLHRKKVEQLRLKLRRTQSRINSGFIQKTLNYFYCLSQDQPEKVSEKILEFSTNLRTQLEAESKGREPEVENRLDFEGKSKPVKKSKIFQFLVNRIAFNIYYIIFIFIFFIFARGSKALSQYHVEAFTFFLLLALPIGIHFFFLEKFFNKKKHKLYSVSVISIIFFFAYFFHWFSQEFFLHNYSFFKSVLEILFVLIIVTAGKVVKDGFKQRIKIQEIEDKQLQMELNLLKSQVNPHFLFNTLNNLYALSLDQSEKLPELLQKLSGLLKYISESSSKNVVPLKQEYDFLQNYLELEKIRLSSIKKITFTVTGDLIKKKISPMLLIPFVENSFKHGVNRKSKDFYVKIYLTVLEDRIVFVVENSKGRSYTKNDSSTGNGLINVKRRLELLYPKDHNLTIENKNNTFKTILEINL